MAFRLAECSSPRASQGQGGLSESRFQLPISRHDIANYLGMVPETISRQFKKLQDQDLVSIQNRDLTIKNAAALRGTIASEG